MEVVKELYDFEHAAPDDYRGPSKYEREFIIGPIASAGLSKMHEAMHTALHHHMGRGHTDRHCCAPSFDPGIRMRSRSLRDSLVYGTRKVRTKGLKVDESIRMLQVKYRSRSIRNSLVYGTRTKRCRHKHCTAWDHQHDWNIELEKWDIPMSMLKNEKRKTLWFEARQSVLDQEMIRRKSIPRNRYGELETDSGLYCGYYLREVVLRPWHQGGHTQDFYRSTRDIQPEDWMWEPDWYDPEPEKIEYHKRKVKELGNWHRRRNLIGSMRCIFARIAEARRQRRHFQRLKLRLKKKVLLWTELNRNSLWFSPWPEGDKQPELIRRSLMAISKRLSTCSPMWNPMFADLPTCEFYLNHLDELCPEIWERFHYNCKHHKHLDLFERRTTLLALIAAANAQPVEEGKFVLPPLCGPVVALEGYRKQWADVKQVWAEILAARPPPPIIIEVVEEMEVEKDARGKKGKITTAAAEKAEEPAHTKGKKAAAESNGKKGEIAQSAEQDKKTLADPKGQHGRLGKKEDQAKKGVGSKKMELALAQDKKGFPKLPDGLKGAPAAQPDEKVVEAEVEMKGPAAKRKRSVKFDPPLLPAQLTFLKRGEGRQSMAKPPPTEEELKTLERLNPPETDEEQSPEPVEEYVPFKFPLRKRRIRWSIQGGKVPVLPPSGTKPPLSKESRIAALDIQDLDKFEAKWETVKHKPEKKGKGAIKKREAPKVDGQKKGVKKK